LEICEICHFYTWMKISWQEIFLTWAHSMPITFWVSVESVSYWAMLTTWFVHISYSLNQQAPYSFRKTTLPVDGQGTSALARGRIQFSSNFRWTVTMKRRACAVRGTIASKVIVEGLVTARGKDGNTVTVMRLTNIWNSRVYCVIYFWYTRSQGSLPLHDIVCYQITRASTHIEVRHELKCRILGAELYRCNHSDSKWRQNDFLSSNPLSIKTEKVKKNSESECESRTTATSSEDVSEGPIGLCTSSDRA
jgi:hypothetical protein